MHQQLWVRQLRTWCLVTVLGCLLLTTGCNKTTAPDAIAGSPKASPTVTPSASPSASPAAQVEKKDEKKDGEPVQFPELARLEGKATVVMTVKGAPITLELDGTNAPVTAGNFLDLVDKKVYDGLIFHRVVRQPQPFVAQGGDPQGKDPNVNPEVLGKGGYIDPATKAARNIPLEIRSASGKLIYSSTFKMANVAGDPKLRHTRGALAMARSEYPDSASSQFYVALSDLAFLDGSYAVFGYVTQGMDVVDKIQQGDRIDSAIVTQGIENLKNRR
jgi:peptidyl-prolyl cis-trans isomerase B (cyclophilin B)